MSEGPDTGDGHADTSAPRDQLVLDQAHRAVDQQVRDLEGVRGRAGNLAGYAVAVVGFLGGIALPDGGPSVWMFLGAVAFLVAVLLIFVILRPQEFTFVLDVPALDKRIDDGDSLSMMTRDVALGTWQNKLNNQSIINKMHGWYQWALLAVNVEAALLLVNLWRGDPMSNDTNRPEPRPIPGVPDTRDDPRTGERTKR